MAIRDEFLQELQELIEIESYTYDLEGVKRVADFFQSRFDALGWYTERIGTGDKTGPILRCSNHDTDRYDVTFIGHMDTVFPRGTLAGFPFRSDDEFVYGPGVADMKQGDLMMYYIAREMPELREKELSVCMLFTPDEECFSLASAPFLQDFARRSGAVIIMEAGWLNGDRCHSRNGKYQARVCFEGIAAHAGYIFDAVNASAILEAAEWTRALMDLRCAEHGFTVNVGTISGGQAANIVPDHAELCFEARFRRPEDDEALRALLKKMLATPFVDGVKVSLHDELHVPPLIPNERTQALAEKLCADGGFSMRHRTGLSDGNTTVLCGCAIIDSMGPAGDGGHGLRERMSIASIEPTLALCKKLIGIIEAGY